MTRRLLSFALAIVALPALAAGPRLTSNQKHALDSMGKDVRVEMDAKDVPSFITGRISERGSADAKAAAEAALERHGAAFRKGNDDGFAYRLQESDELGMTHVRMTQTYRGLPVVGGELIVHMTKDAITGINGRFVADMAHDTHVSLSDARAANAAIAYIQSLNGLNVRVSEIQKPVIYAADDDASLAVPVLVQYDSVNGPEMDVVYLHGHSGVALGREPHVFRAKSRKLYNANQACISTGNELPGTLLFSEGGSSTDTAAMGAYNGTGKTYDYYKNIHGRDSYDAAGAILVSSVHAQFSSGTSCSKNNAAWFDSPQNQMAYGDGDGSQFSNLANGLDVTAHELSHAVCARTANLTYAKESGALNEANSDIMGRSAAFYNGDGNSATQADWAIGKDVYTPATSGDALRYMYNPTADGYSADYYPERLYSGTCTASQSNDECGVHGNSGIANLFYYLLSKGGTHPRGKTTVSVTGVGVTVAEKIWYRALSTYMTSSTNFSAARTATANAATDLYTSCSAQYIAVQTAWDAVGVPGTWSCGGGGTDTQLTSGVTLNSQSVALSSWKYYYITVPAGATNLTFTTTNATGDVDIYTQFNAKPTSSTYVCRPYTSSGNETCSATNPSAGTWWLGVYGYAAGNYSVTATVTTGTTTYSISGNAGTSGATVSTTGHTATSDASSNYTLSGLAAGTYTVTPSKSGCTFSPTSQSVTVGPNATGKNFTATCGGAAVTLFSNGLESATGWYVQQVSGTAGAWSIAASGTHPAVSPHSGSYMGLFNSYTSASGNQTRLYNSTAISASSYTTVTVKFWMYHDTGYSTSADKIQVQVSNNGGSTWSSVGSAVNRYTGATGWTQHSVDVSAYKGSAITVGFVGISAYGNDIHLDDVMVIGQ